jgi:uncharacterized protein with gpF-like domain
VATQRQRDPIRVGTASDRTGAGGIFRRAAAAIRKRWAGVERDVLRLFDSIPTYAVNDERIQAVRYGVTAEQLQSIAAELQATMARWIAEPGRAIEHFFWWDAYVDEAGQLGAAQSVANLGALSASYAAARTLEQVVYSEPYRNRIAAAKFKSYEHWTGTSAQMRAELAQVIGQAVADGLAPREARRLIRERMDVSKARALSWAQTDITDTLRQARMAEAEDAEAQLGVKTGLLWQSALIPTTRPWHASRHGKFFTRDQVRAFYAERGNRYGCRCSITEALLDADGKPILTKKAQSSLSNERATWFSRYRKD